MATFPERALAWVNGALVAITDALLKPLADLPPFVSLLLLSLLTAAAMVLVIGRTSDQARLRQTKRRIQAALFEIRLFNDDPRAVLRSAGEALGHNLAYLRLSLVPLAVLVVPLVLLVAHLHPFFGYAGLRPGAAALLEVEWRADQAASIAGIPSLLAEVAGMRSALEQKAARRIVAGVEQALTLAEVADVLASGDLVVDACRRRL